MDRFEQVRQVLGDVLQLGERAERLRPESGLIGELPEFDSLAVVGLIAALEDEFGITIHDDDISGETFETLAALTQFVESKLAH
ncbi:MAG: acyl carrier protein [Chromatiaceae bacterium]|jgi:acyl carrier protein